MMARRGAMNRNACSASSYVVLAWLCCAAVASPARAAEPPEDQGYIIYQLRAGEDPGTVARMFRVSVSDLLALNHISDAHRLATGANLKIPDPRAVLVEQLRRENAAVAAQLSAAQSTVAQLQANLASAQSTLAGLRDANESLHASLAFYEVWR